jgi:outer membrane protein assembly factor BamB
MLTSQTALFAALAKTAWPMFRQNIYHTAVSTIPASGSVGVLKWKYQTLGNVNSSPSIGSDGTIYVGSDDQYLHALNPNGSLKWEFDCGGFVYSSPAIGDDGTIYVGSNNSDYNLFAINPNGSEKWHYATGNFVYSSPVISTNGIVYAGSLDNNLYALNPNGSLKWVCVTTGTVVSSPAIAKDGTVYFGSFDQFVYAVNPSTGGIKWKFETDATIQSSPAVDPDDGTIYIGTDFSSIYALNPNGTQKWVTSAGGDVISSPAIGPDGTVYIGSDDGNLYALDPDDGDIIWQYATGGPIGQISPAVAADGTIYIACEDNNLYGIKPDGSLKWKYQMGGTGNRDSSPSIGPDGTVYLGSLDNCLYAVKVTTPPVLSWTGEANYTSDGLSPEIGQTLNTFTFRVKYADANSDAPLAGYPKLHIKKAGAEIAGSPFTMTFVSGNNSTGAIYTYPKTLSTAGNDYTYYFEAFDVWGATGTGTPTTPLTGPDVISLTSINPSSLYNSAPASTMSIVGVGFFTGSTVKFSKTGQSDVPGNSVVVSSTLITCAVDFKGSATGYWDLVVSTGGANSSSVTFSNVFLFSSMTITGITPSNAFNSGPVTITNLGGNGFVSGSNVRLAKSGQSPVMASNVSVVSPTQITCVFPGLAGSATGYWDVIVTTGGAGTVSATLANGFVVVPMTATGITPDNAYNTGPVTITNLAGNGFVTGSNVHLHKTGQTDLTATNVSVVTATQISCTFGLLGSATGYWDVVVTTGTAGSSVSATFGNGFRILPMTATAITPSNGFNSGPISITNLAGNGFSTGATVKLSKLGQADINATNVSVVSANQISCVFGLAGVTTGFWDVVVTTGPVSATYASGFFVNPMTLNSMTPNNGYYLAPLSVTNLAGAGFVSGSTFRITKTGQANIDATGVAFVNNTKLTGTLNITGAATGYWDVVVDTGGASSFSVTLSSALFVNIIAFDSITPDLGYNSGPVSITDLEGHGFSVNSSVKLKRSGQSDILASNNVLVNSGKITCTFDLTGKATGYWDAVVSTGGAGSSYATLTNGFQIAPMEVTSISPNVAYATGTISITNLAGVGFVSGSTIMLSKTGQTNISATNVGITPSAITCSFDLTNVSTGYWSVTVSTGGVGSISATLADGLLIKARIVQTDLSRVRAFPIPYNPNFGNMTFDNLTADASIKLFTISGQLIATLDNSAGNGRATWNGSNDSGTRIASGIYIVFIKSASGTKKLKIAVEK